MVHFVFRIGPLPQVQTPSSAYFVFPGEEGVETFFASSDEEALLQIGSGYEPAQLECEPQLAVAASKSGMAVGPITPDRAAILALLTFELALPDHFREIKNHDIVYQYGMACSAFWRSAPWRLDEANGALQITFSGAVAKRVEATVLGRTGKQFGLAIFPGVGSLQTVSRLIQDHNVDDVASLDMLGVTLETEPAFAIDGMIRSFELDRFPLPMKTVNGERVRLTDQDLLVLACALRAISTSSDKEAKGIARIGVNDIAIEAVVTPMAAD
jgi:hypothetical protein